MGGASTSSIHEEARRGGHVRNTSNESIQEVDEGTKED
jgi:hypothetical protein